MGIRVKHVKTGDMYEVLGEGRVQARGGLQDMDKFVLYRGVDAGDIWIRPPDEFYDGRFEEMPGDFEMPAGIGFWHFFIALSVWALIGVIVWDAIERVH